MSKHKPSKRSVRIRKELATAQYNGIIDTQLKVIDDLKAEVERLTKAIEGSSYYFMSIKLNVENARLRKAGDAMAVEVNGRYFGKRLIKDWNAAKEGKPSA